MSIKVLLADDAECMRNAITRLLKRDPEIQIVAQAASVPQILEIAGKLRPDVVVMDLHLGDDEKINPLRLKSSLGTARVVAMSAWNDESTKALADRLGADAFLDKMDLVSHLIPAIKGRAKVIKYKPNGRVPADS
jgi:DNA-binding NarL/FixJ family response regulator